MGPVVYSNGAQAVPERIRTDRGRIAGTDELV